MERRGPGQDNGGRVGTAALPPHLLRLFAPRPPLPYAKPLDRDPGQKDEPRMTPVSQYLDMCKDHDANYVPTLSMAERKKQKVQDRNREKDEEKKKGSDLPCCFHVSCPVAFMYLALSTNIKVRF